jgi:hypothetical protein
MTNNDTLANDTPMITPNADVIIPKILLTLTPGQSVVYHTGYLAADRGPDTRADSTLANIRKIAKLAMQLSDQGVAHLTQRRHLTPHKFPYYEYIITRAK